MTRITVLGGASPFTAGLFRALAAHPPQQDPDTVTLWGRDADALALLAEHGSHVLGEQGGAVIGHTDLARALDGADLVVQQIRFGRLAGRATAEDIARAHGVPADETLGPGGLLNAILIRREVEALARSITADAPGARVLIMTNPLSVATTLFSEFGVDALGSCELPEVTARSAYAACGVPYDPCGWSTVGMNHRGFIVRLRAGDADLMPVLAAAFAAHGDPAAAAEVDALGALPTKYFALLRSSGLPVANRAAELEQLRKRLLAEIAADPRSSPSGLDQRPSPWFDIALVPLVRACRSSTPVPLVLTRPGPDRLARERHCLVSVDELRVLPEVGTPATVAALLQQFADHERALLVAAEHPSRPNLEVALALDPTVGPARADACAAAVEAALREGQRA